MECAKARSRLGLRAFGGVVALGLAPPLLSCATTLGPDGAECPVVAARGGARPVLSMEPGDICTLGAESAGRVDFAPAGAAAQYLAVVQSVGRTASARAGLRLEVRGRDAPPGTTPALARAPLPRPDPHLEDASRAELELRANIRRALAGARPLRAPRRDRPEPGESLAARRSAGLRPATGDTVTFHNVVNNDLTLDCTGVHDITAVVRAAGSHVAIAEDVVAAGAVSAEEYALAAETLDRAVLPVVTAYLGEPADLDDNGVVWVLFTPVVNRLTPRGSDTRILGFFSPSDLADSESCAASNRGELLYIVAADPAGRFSKAVPEEFVNGRALSVVAHELAHLVAAEGRIALGGGTFADLEDAWLSEALAHSVETSVGMSLGMLRPGQDYDFAALAGDPAVFDVYHFANFRRTAFHLANPGATPALGDDSGNDPGGISSLAMRGFGWLFLRWIADQYAPASGGLLGGPREEAIFRELAVGGDERRRGVDNIERVAAMSGAPAQWESLLEAYALVPLADDLPGWTAASTQLTSFQLRNTFAALHREQGREPFDREYPLLRTTIELSDTTRTRVEFDLRAATGRHFVFESAGPRASVQLGLRTQSGGTVPAGANVRLVVHRIR